MGGGEGEVVAVILVVVCRVVQLGGSCQAAVVGMVVVILVDVVIVPQRGICEIRSNGCGPRVHRLGLVVVLGGRVAAAESAKGTPTQEFSLELFLQMKEKNNCEAAAVVQKLRRPLFCFLWGPPAALLLFRECLDYCLKIPRMSLTSNNPNSHKIYAQVCREQIKDQRVELTL